MSQAKVEQYKKEKANRRKIIAKQKRQRLCAILCGWMVCAAIVIWAGYSAVSYYQSRQPAKTYQITTKALDDYLTDLSANTEQE